MADLIIAGLRGRNGTDHPLSLPDWQACEMQNVDISTGRIAERRAGSTSLSVTFSSGGPFSGGIGSLLRHVPEEDETAAELWAVDTTGQICRLAGGTQWTEPTRSDNPSSAIGVTGASLGGNFWLTYETVSQNRSFVWDGTSVRRRGFATPSVPTLATLGGAGLTMTRAYRVRWAEISGSDRIRQSEPSTAASLSITDDSGIQVTRPTAAGEGETHWIVEYADSTDGPFFEVAEVAIATTTYDDTAATVDTENDLSAPEGDYMPPPAFKYTVAAGGRLLNAGAHHPNAGSSFVPQPNEVYWSPIDGATDVGDLERQPPTYRVVLDHPVVGLSEGVNGLHYAMGYRGISALIPTQNTGEQAFHRLTERMDIGALRHEAMVVGEDEVGRACLYFWSHRGPYRIGASGVQYLGSDIEDIVARVNLDASELPHGVFYADKREVWYWLPVDDEDAPTLRVRFFTQFGVTDGDEVRGGWVIDDGLACLARCSTLFSSTVGASMTHALKPYFGSTAATAILKGDTGTDDSGTDYQAYVDTKEYAPAGLGRNVTLREPHLVAASIVATTSVTLQMDFGSNTTVSAQISLSPTRNETHVHRKIDGFQGSECGTFRLRLGDESDTDPGFDSLDAVLLPWEAAQPR